MKKLLITAAAMAGIVALIGVLAVGSFNGGGSDNAALAAFEGQEDVFSSLNPAQEGATTDEKPWLGAQVVLTPDGLTISLVIADSPAHKAGLVRGDVIEAVDGTPVSDMADLHEALADKQTGDTLILSINRDGATQDVTVTLEARPEPLPRAHPLFPELNGIPRDQMFSHMLGGTFQFTDVDGNEYTVAVDLGTVTAVDTSGKTITVDLNSGGSETYTITADVLTAPNDLSQFQSGNRVSITSVDGDLRIIAKGPGRMLPFFGAGKHHGMRGFGMHRFGPHHFRPFGSHEGSPMPSTTSSEITL